MASVRDIRPYIYGILNLAFASMYAYAFTTLIPSRHTGTRIIIWSLIAVVAAKGVSMIVARRWSWLVAALGCMVALLIAFLMFALCVSSTAFLSGVYGAYGRGASAMTLVGAALIIELVALVPALQLKYLMTRAGRRRFGLEPLAWGRK
jgi:fucose 4-O-acetylase-like acetyltransferase